MPICKSSLKNVRLDAGLSQSKLARKAELDRATISNAENGKEVTELTVAKICSALSDTLGRPIRSADVMKSTTTSEKPESQATGNKQPATAKGSS